MKSDVNRTSSPCKIGLTLPIVCSLLLTFLNGCIGGATAGLTALTAGSQTMFWSNKARLNSGGSANFKSTRNTPDPTAKKEIAKSKSLAIYPFQNGSDGAAIDIYRAKTDLKVISSTKTISWVKKTGNANLNSMPLREKLGTARNLARAMRADMVLLIEPLGNKANAGFLGSVTVFSNWRVTLVSRRSGKELWSENIVAEIKAGATTPPPQEINRVINEGISARITELRSL